MGAEIHNNQSLVPRLAYLNDYLDAHVANFPEREAAVEDDIRLSYSDLGEAVRTFAAALKERGICQGHVVAFMGPPGVHYLISLLATQRIGATWLGLNPKYRSRELAYVLQNARPRMVVVGSAAESSSRIELNSAISEYEPQLKVVELSKGVTGLAHCLSSIPANFYDLCEIQDDIVSLNASVLVYTSGSTGSPKGACLTQSNLIENALWLSRRLSDPGGRFLINLPVNHAGCIADTTLVGILQGDTLVFMSSFDAVRAAQLIRDERITIVGQVPTQYQLMQAAGVLTPEYLGTLRHLAWGGAAMPRPLIEFLSGFVPDLFNSYGLTESTGTVTVTPRGASIDALACAVGQPVFDGILRIQSSDGALITADDEQGEVQIFGPHVFPGYLRNPQATQSSLGKDGWLRTGDLGCWREDGSLCLVGRLTEMYKSGGYNIYPREVETVLEAYPDIVMTAVIGMQDPLWGEVGYAFVLADSEMVTAEALEKWCRERLAAYKVPKRFVIRKDLPMLPIGKIDRKQLPALASGN